MTPSLKTRKNHTKTRKKPQKTLKKPLKNKKTARLLDAAT
jgi:hypothetical protein